MLAPRSAGTRRLDHQLVARNDVAGIDDDVVGQNDFGDSMISVISVIR